MDLDYDVLEGVTNAVQNSEEAARYVAGVVQDVAPDVEPDSVGTVLERYAQNTLDYVQKDAGEDLRQYLEAYESEIETASAIGGAGGLASTARWRDTMRKTYLSAASLLGTGAQDLYQTQVKGMEMMDAAQDDLAVFGGLAASAVGGYYVSKFLTYLDRTGDSHDVEDE